MSRQRGRMTADRTIVDGQTDSGQWTFFSFASGWAVWMSREVRPAGHDGVGSMAGREIR